MTSTPSLLNKERCLVFNPTLAKLIGDRQAILLQQIQYWLDINEQSKSEYNYREGHWWTYNTYEAWVEESFPFWSTRMLRRLMKDLEEKGLVITKKFECSDWKQRKWYTIDYDAVESLKNAESTEKSDVTDLATSNQPNGADHLYTETTSKTSPYRTAFSSKSAVSDFQDVFDSSDQGELEDNCTTTLANPSTNGRIPNSQKEKQRSGSSKKPNKPKKRKLFDGTSGLSCDRNGWIELPKTIDTAPEYREVMGKAKAQTLVWMKDYMAFRYPGELDVEVTEWTDGSFTISGKDFSEMPYNEFLGKDGPMSVQLMRDVIMERTGGFQEEFNEQMNEYFWDAWHKFTKKAA